MKRIISILLSLLMVLSLAACVRVKSSGTASTESQPGAATDSEGTPTPTAAPTPAPTEVPFDVVIANANKKLENVGSMHADVKLNMSIELFLSIGGSSQSMPMDINLLLRMDTIKDPFVTRIDLSMSTPDEKETNGIIYAVRNGEDTILYVSEDNGVTWEKQTNPQNSQLTQSPAATIDQFSGAMVDIQKTGTAQVNGATAIVYSGKLPGKYLGELLNSTGAASDMSSILGSDVPEDVLANLSDIEVTIMIDEESGLPVRYTIDMTAAMKELMEAVLIQSTGVSSLEEAGVTLDIPSVVLDIVMSQFDSIDTIEIPEAALNAPEAASPEA